MTPSSTTKPPPLRIVSFLESNFVTGPAKNVLQFAHSARQPDPAEGLPAVELSIVTFARPHDGPNGLIDGARRAGLKVHVLEESGPFDPSLLPKVRQLIHSLAPDIIQTHHVKSHFLIARSGLNRSYPWIAFHHGYTATNLKQRLYNQFDRWSLHRPDHLVAVCGPFKNQLTALGIAPERISILHNTLAAGPAPDSAAPNSPAIEAARALVPAGIPILLIVGRLSHEKGHLDLIAALKLLQSQHPQLPWHALFIGEGPARTPLTAAMARAGLAARITLAGHQVDVKPFYGLADLFVMPSHSEGSPNALLEAMMARVPIVATHVGGIPEIVTHGETALLVPPSDPSALAAALAQLLANPALAQRLALAAQRQALDHHQPSAYRRQLARIHLEVLRQKGAPALTHAS